MLAADPPLISIAPPSAWYRYSARSVSTSVIDPLTKLVLGDERVVGVGDHVDQRIADADDVVLMPARVRHGATRYLARAGGRRTGL